MANTSKRYAYGDVQARLYGVWICTAILAVVIWWLSDAILP